MRSVYGVLKRSAARRGIHFSLSIERFAELSAQNCHSCGKAPSNRYHVDGMHGDFIYSTVIPASKDEGYSNNGSVSSCGSCAKSFWIRKDKTSLRKLLKLYEKGAEKRGIAFALSESQFERIIRERCSYCNEPPSERFYGKNGYLTLVCNGVDRVDNNIGYTPENSVACCKRCNRGKFNMSRDEFLSWISAVHRTAVAVDKP